MLKDADEIRQQSMQHFHKDAKIEVVGYPADVTDPEYAPVPATMPAAGLT